MIRKTLFNLFLLTAILGNGAGIHQVFAQEPQVRADVTEMEDAIAAYQEGSQGDVIRYLMQRGYEGNIAAQFNLGVINYQREDQGVGAKEAQFWFAEAAEEGDLVAQMNLGILKVNAGRAAKNAELLAEGARWLRRAAESGLRSAQVNLGGLIAAGLLDWPRKGEGRAWLNLASAAGDPRASEMLTILSQSGEAQAILSLLYPVDEQMRSQPYRGGSKVKTSDAPVYAEPSAELQPMATINTDMLVEVLDRSGEWVSVKIPAGLPVWIMASLVKLENDLVKVDRLEAPLFSGPEGSAEAISMGTVTKGETLQLIEDRGEWLVVRSPGRFAGWMKQADIVSKITSDAESGMEPPAQIGDISQITASDSSAPVLGKMISDAELFQLPERQSELLGVVTSKSEIRITDDSDGFVFVEAVKVSGWVSKRLLKLQQRSDTGGLTAIVNTNVARVRSRPDLQSIGFGRLTRNEEVLVVEQLDEWIRVELGTGSGWINAQLVVTQKEQEAVVSSVEGTTISTVESTAEGAGENALTDQPQIPLPEEIGEEEQLLAGLSDEPVVQLADTINPVDVSVAVKNDGNQSQAIETTSSVEAAADTPAAVIKIDSVLYSENTTTSSPLGRVSSPVSVAEIDPSAMIQLVTPIPVYGWVFASLTRENAGQVEINSNGVRIRLDPTTGRDNIIGARNRGDRLLLLERQNDWIKVALNPVSGWVLSSEIE